MAIAQCRAVLTPNLHLWGIYLGSLLMLITEGAVQKVEWAEEVWQEEELLVAEWDGWRALELSVPLDPSHPQWLEQLCSVIQWPPVHYSYGKGGTSRKAPEQQLHRLGHTDH